MIDGAIHPELITDSTAYRLYLLMISEPATQTVEGTQRQKARLDKVGLEGPDRQTLIAIWATFHSSYAKLIAEYNDAANRAWAHQDRTDKTQLIAQREALVEFTRDTMKGALTSEGWARLDRYVQSEKRHMKISAPAVEQ